MEITSEDFLKNFTAQFENTDPSEITMDTKFKDLEEWDSMIALILIAMADEVYEIRLAGDDIRNSSTVEELYNLIKTKAQ